MREHLQGVLDCFGGSSGWNGWSRMGNGQIWNWRSELSDEMDEIR